MPATQVHIISSLAITEEKEEKRGKKGEHRFPREPAKSPQWVGNSIKEREGGRKKEKRKRSLQNHAKHSCTASDEPEKKKEKKEKGKKGEHLSRSSCFATKKRKKKGAHPRKLFLCPTLRREKKKGEKLPHNREELINLGLSGFAVKGGRIASP